MGTNDRIFYNEISASTKRVRLISTDFLPKLPISLSKIHGDTQKVQCCGLVRIVEAEPQASWSGITAFSHQFLILFQQVNVKLSSLGEFKSSAAPTNTSPDDCDILAQLRVLSGSLHCQSSIGNRSSFWHDNLQVCSALFPESMARVMKRIIHDQIHTLVRLFLYLVFGTSKFGAETKRSYYTDVTKTPIRR